MIATSLALRFLAVVLFIFTNGQGITARDLKVELQDQKQVDLKDVPYITGYGATTKPNYAATYTTTKQNNHLSHAASQPMSNGRYKTRSHDSNVPYIAAYGDQENQKPNYLAGYRTHTHDSNSLYGGAYEGYTTRSHDSNKPYNANYDNQKTEKPNYLAGYRAHTDHDSNGVYAGAYEGYTTRSHESNKPYNANYGNQETEKPNYLAGYRAHTDHDSNGLYAGAYEGYTTRSHNSNKPYNANYDNQEPKNPNYLAGYRAHSDHDSNGLYAGAYEGYTTRSHDSNGPYTANYDSQETKKPNTHDSHSLYGGTYEGYTTRSHDSNGPYTANHDNQETEKPNYLTKYGGHDSSGDARDSKKSLSPNMDRLEAFKIGFFTLDDLYVGNVMTLQFPIQEVAPFLSTKEADSIPLSMSQLPSVFQLFSIPEGSSEANSIRGTVEQCEGEAIIGETKICAKSLESMLEFVDKVIGSDTKSKILTTTYPSPSAIPLQKYTILEVSHDINSPKWVACHPLPYPYALHYCHFISTGTKMFKATLAGENNGDKIEALGVCHLDTSGWSADHKIFKQLAIKAGKDQEVCHFFPVKHLMWVPDEPLKEATK